MHGQQNIKFCRDNFVSLMCDKNNGHFTVRRMNIYDNFSLDYFCNEKIFR